MPIIWCAISGHGYGHAAQVVPVLNALGSLVPGLTAILRTTVPASFFHDRLTIQWELSPRATGHRLCPRRPPQDRHRRNLGGAPALPRNLGRTPVQRSRRHAGGITRVGHRRHTLPRHRGRFPRTDTDRRLGELYLGPRAQGILPCIRQFTPAVDSVHP